MDPKAIETITENGVEYVKVTEGKASTLMPKENEVFYNPIQQFNRDMSIAAINSWREIYIEEKKAKKEKKKESSESANFVEPKIKILEALAASGMRSLRYAQEIDGVDYILANDLSEEAVESIKRNSSDVLYSCRQPSKQYDVIDLDPYGSAIPFIDASIQAVKNGGLLCITCTDMAVLASNNHPETCYAKYGGVPIRSEFCHELGLRLLLHSVQSSATRYQRFIKPVLSCSIDFYIRVFVRVYDSAKDTKDAIVNTGIVNYCTGCTSFFTQPFGVRNETKNTNYKYTASHVSLETTNCKFCSTKLVIGGPCWIGSIQDPEFANRMYNRVKADPSKFFTNKRMMGMLKVISEELQVPFHYTLSALCSSVKATCPPITTISSAILNAGYKVSSAHSCTCSIKTNAPGEVIWDVMRAYVKTINKSKNIAENSAADKILSVEPTIKVDFTKHPEATSESKKTKLVRYQLNPEKFWGPKSKHKTSKRKVDQLT
ncbi:hypothetical protein BB559_000873 [Furculomyces boomerangus]|uniref:tRNA (guanine(26)-N(2))-dimethyltransferase n=2 Tax=Harpellales TaxID=61421 RepID=A0A2T9Z3T4_9FUNG|nr:hypothetical protein BB559_000873 [Furculomyces boomerangus]PWA00660.1 hypothetical protein BB558_003288 [Smittium angustum]